MNQPSFSAPVPRPFRRLSYWLALLVICVLAFVVGLKIAHWLAGPRLVLARPLAATQSGRYLSAHVAQNSGLVGDALRLNLDALNHDPKNPRLQINAYRTALFSGDFEALAKLAAQLPAEAEPALPPGFVLAMGIL